MGGKFRRRILVVRSFGGDLGVQVCRPPLEPTLRGGEVGFQRLKVGFAGGCEPWLDRLRAGR
jgi:hypothetical protein